MCDFRKPYFLNGEAVPYGGGISLEALTNGNCLQLKEKHCYVVMLTGSWCVYYENNKFSSTH